MAEATDSDLPPCPALDYLADIHAAYAAGFDAGEHQGRRSERAIIEQEHRSAVAGNIVRRLAEFPEISPEELRRRREGRARTAERIAALPYRKSCTA